MCDAAHAHSSVSAYNIRERERGEHLNPMNSIILESRWDPCKEEYGRASEQRQGQERASGEKGREVFG